MSSGALTPHEATRLAHCEAIIEANLASYINVGLAIIEIQEGRLYRALYGTFEEYVRQRWGLDRSGAYRLARAANVTRMLRETDTTSPSPVRESQVRPLVQLESDEDKKKAWNIAVESSEGKQPTAAAVKAAVDQVKGAPQTAALRSSESNEWGTPEHVLLAARLVLGVIDLDPASSESFNARVKATSFIGKDKDGLSHQWRGRVWCNPPYGRDEKGDSQQGIWFRKAVEEVDKRHADVVAFLCTASVGRAWFREVLSHPVVLFSERLRFVRPDGSVGPNPTHGNCLALITRDILRWETKFVEAFRKLGTVLIPTEVEGLVESVQ